MYYNYRKEMKEDIKEYIKENHPEATMDDFDELYDELFIEDSVTGNASGSYTFNRFDAQEYVCDNMELCQESLKEYCVPAEKVAKYFLEGDWEYFDVTIRCYLLGEVLDDVLKGR